MPRGSSPLLYRLGARPRARVFASAAASSGVGPGRAGESAGSSSRALDELLAAAPAYVAVCRGADHRVERASAAMAALGARDADAVTAAGLTLEAVCDGVAQADRAGLLALCDKVFATGEPARAAELSLAQPGGRDAGLRERWLDVTVTPRRAPGRNGEGDGAVHGVIVHGTDVSSHVAARRVSEARCAQLVDEARQAVRARDEFFAMATHELKTPISVLQLKCELLDRDAARREALARDDVRRALAPVHRQLQRLGALLDNLLDLARIRNQHLQLDIEAVDLCAVVEATAQRLGDAARQAGCELTVQRCAEPVVGYWDRLRLEQVVANLLTNAFRYGAGRPVRVAVRAGANTARIVVRDEGVGIAAADHARIFERFERSTEAFRPSSLGLGLYVVRAIVEAHGGRVTVDSRPGEGAAFTVEVPIRRIPNDATT